MLRRCTLVKKGSSFDWDRLGEPTNSGKSRADVSVLPALLFASTLPSAMNTPSLTRRYRQPLVANGLTVLVLGGLLLLIAAEQDGPGSIVQVLVFLTSLWLLPIVNVALFVVSLFTRQRYLSVAYGYLSAVLLALTWMLWSEGLKGLR